MKPATTKNHSANQHEPSFHGCEAERSMGTFEQDTELSWMDGDGDRGRGGGTGERGGLGDTPYQLRFRFSQRPQVWSLLLSTSWVHSFDQVIHPTLNASVFKPRKTESSPWSICGLIRLTMGSGNNREGFLGLCPLPCERWQKAVAENTV